MRKHKQIHTLGTPHYKVHFVSLRKLEDFKCALWSKNYGTLEQGNKPVFQAQKNRWVVFHKK